MKLCIFDLDDTLYDTSFRIDDVTPNFQDMHLYPGVEEILGRLNGKCVLVTFGEASVQDKKIDTLKIRSFFREIFIAPKVSDKLELFRSILKKHSIVNPKEVMVVGDRVDSEIRYGNILGCNTVWIKKGKYANLTPKDEMEVPTHLISELSELRSFL